jgi:hypothetical protein
VRGDEVGEARNEDVAGEHGRKIHAHPTAQRTPRLERRRELVGVEQKARRQRHEPLALRCRSHNSRCALQ